MLRSFKEENSLVHHFYKSFETKVFTFSLLSNLNDEENKVGIGYFYYQIKAVGAQALLCELNLVTKNNSLISLKISIKIKWEHPKYRSGCVYNMPIFVT